MNIQNLLPPRPDSVILKGEILPGPRAVAVAGTHYEMGRQHGEQMRDLIIPFTQDIEASCKRLGMVGDQFEELLAKNEDLMTQMTPDVLEELRGVSEGAKIIFLDALKMYLVPDMGYAIPYEEMRQKVYGYSDSNECTAFIVNTGGTDGGKPFVLQNRDSSASAAGTARRITVVAKPTNGYALVSHSRPGRNGGFGVNEAGLAISATAVNATDSVKALAEYKPCGIQGYALGKLILENCATIDEAMDYLKTTPGGYMGLNISLADCKGGVVRLERSYDHQNYTYPEVTLNDKGNFITATNHFPSRNMNPLSPPREKYEGTYYRYDRAREILQTQKDPIDLKTMINFARDHNNGPGEFSICNHGEKTCSNSSILAEPAKRRFWVLSGTPCQNEYVEYSIP